MKVFALGVLLADAVAFRVLPDIALFAGNAMCAVVKILTMHTTDSAVKDPLILLFGQLVEFSLPSLHFQLEVALRHASVRVVHVFAILLELLQFFLM